MSVFLQRPPTSAPHCAGVFSSLVLGLYMRVRERGVWRCELTDLLPGGAASQRRLAGPRSPVQTVARAWGVLGDHPQREAGEPPPCICAPSPPPITLEGGFRGGWGWCAPLLNRPLFLPARRSAAAGYAAFRTASLPPPPPLRAARVGGDAHSTVPSLAQRLRRLALRARVARAHCGRVVEGRPWVGRHSPAPRARRRCVLP